jgi:hypothetical protein
VYQQEDEEQLTITNILILRRLWHALSALRAWKFESCQLIA